MKLMNELPLALLPVNLMKHIHCSLFWYSLQRELPVDMCGFSIALYIDWIPVFLFPFDLIDVEKHMKSTS